MLGEIILLFTLILLNAFFAASEMALISLNDNKLRLMVEEGNSKAKLLKKLLDEPSRFLSTIQIGITLAGFLASAFAAETYSAKFAGILKLTGIPVTDSWLRHFSTVLITLVLSYFTLVFGELVPKRVAMKKAEAISMFSVKPLIYLSLIVNPFVKLLSATTNLFMRLFGFNPDVEDEKVTEEEIRMMVDIGEEKGTIHETEKIMINNVFEFNNKTVGDIMTHRINIAALPIESTLYEVAEFINNEKYSRIPIYEGNIDNIIGVMHAKYLIQFLTQNKKTEDFTLKNIIRVPYFVPESRRTDELFKEMQKSKTHFAVIVDEYGGTAGIVTLEDLIEEVMGNIFDEDDEEEVLISSVDDNTVIMDGLTELHIVEEYLGIDFSGEDYGTLSGFIIGHLGRIPEKGETPMIEFKGVKFKVEIVDDNRILKAKVCKK